MNPSTFLFSRLATGVDLSTFPQELAVFLNISLFAGQLLSSTIILCFTIFPTLMLTRARNQTGALLLVGLTTMGFLVAVGWLPIWTMMIICIFFGLMIASRVKKVAG